MKNLHVSKHPLLLHKLSILRDQTTPPTLFRDCVHQLTKILLFEASSKLSLQPKSIQTPLAQMNGQQLSQRIGVVPILRAGIGMASAILELIPEAIIWHLGLYRDHSTHQPIWYYDKLHSAPNVDMVFLVDPMLATGGSLVSAIDRLYQWGIQDIILMSLIAAPEGVKMVQEKYPQVPIFLGAIDSYLNENKYIVPGLGDAGDRQFGTF